jgi:hypothetical protein
MKAKISACVGGLGVISCGVGESSVSLFEKYQTFR